MESYKLEDLGWTQFFADQITDGELDGGMVARVSAHQRSVIHFLTEAGEIAVANSLIEVKIRDETDNLCADVAVGDWILLDRSCHRAIRRLVRKSEMVRKAAGETVKPQVIAANFDTVFIVSSCNDEFSPSRIERYLAIVLESRAEPVVVLTKSDLCDDTESLKWTAEALYPDLVVIDVDARDAVLTKRLSPWCKTGKTISLVGSSGVGKSTLANALGGHDIKTSGIREADSKGRHTTTARSMHRLKDGGWLIDNPGMRELQLAECEQGVNDLFEDVLQLAEGCRFSNCHHQGDAGCAVEAALENGTLDSRRFRNFQKLQSEQQRNSSSLAERRERDRKQGKLYKTIIGDKKKRRGQ